MATTRRAFQTRSTSRVQLPAQVAGRATTKRIRKSRLRLGDVERDQHARHLCQRPAAQQGQLLQRRGAVGRDTRGVVEVLCGRAIGRRAASPGPASIIAASLPRMAGHRSTRSSASSTCADFRRTTSTTTRRGGGKSRCVHVFPHWNWTGREGEEIKVWVYSNQDEVELFVNGKSAGSAESAASRSCRVEGEVRARQHRGTRHRGTAKSS